MDLSYFDEIFHFYEPDVNSHSWMHDALEQMNSTDVLVDLSIATVTCGLLLGFYTYRRSRRAKAKSPSSNCTETIRCDLQVHRDVDRLRGIELFPENATSSLGDDTELLTDDLSSSTSSLFAQSDDNAEPLVFNISMPEKDVSDSKERGDATSVTGDGAAKVKYFSAGNLSNKILNEESNENTIYKKMIQDGVNSRLKLLLAEKKIYAQMKKMQSLKRSLLESAYENPAQDSTLNKTSIAISRRKSFFVPDRIDKTFLKPSSIGGLKSVVEEDATRVKLMNLKESINQLIDVHMNELSALHESIAEKRMYTRKLEAMKKEIDSLHEKIENGNNRDKDLTVEDANNNKIVDLHDKIIESNLAERGEDKKSYDKNLVNQLQSISSLKSLFKNYDNEQELSTIMEKTNEDEENSLILLNDISTLNRDLKSIKKSWSRSSTPRKSPGAEQPVST